MVLVYTPRVCWHLLPRYSPLPQLGTGTVEHAKAEAERVLLERGDISCKNVVVPRCAPCFGSVRLFWNWLLACSQHAARWRALCLANFPRTCTVKTILRSPENCVVEDPTQSTRVSTGVRNGVEHLSFITIRKWIFFWLRLNILSSRNPKSMLHYSEWKRGCWFPWFRVRDQNFQEPKTRSQSVMKSWRSRALSLKFWI